MLMGAEQDLVTAERERSLRLVQVTLGALALMSLIVGLGIYAVSGRIGVPEDIARIVASAFLAAAIADAIALYLWERLFRERM